MKDWERLAFIAQEFQGTDQRLAFSASLGLEDQVLLDAIARVVPDTGYLLASKT